MVRHPQEDLFEDTKMTFGEHIEELRTALFQAILGLAVGVAVGFFLANNVVMWIQTPLERALYEYYLVRAKEDAAKQYQGEIPYEMLTVIESEGLAPTTMKVSAESLHQILQQTSPEQFGGARYTPHRLAAADLAADNGGDFLGDWIDAAEDEDAPERHLWRLLTTEQQQTLRRIAALEAPTADDAREVVAILNTLIDRPAMHQAAVMDELSGIDAFMEEALTELRAKREEGGLSSDESRRLNRLLLTAVFPQYVKKPRVALVDLPFWTPIKVTIISLGAQEAFMIWLKAAFITGLVVSAPWVFWKMWEFVAAGLYPHEKHYVYIYLPFSLGLFFAGSGLAFFFVFEPVLSFLFKFNRAMNIDPDPRISEWLSFVLFLPLGFGISFQLPLVMLFLQRIGIFTVEQYVSKWRIAILVIFVISMVLTPADPISMLLMACPLSVLYFGGVGLCLWMPRSRNPYRELQAYEP